MQAWEEKLFDEAYEKTIAFLENRLQHDNDFSMTELNALLESEYLREDIAWAGTSTVQDIRQQARIAAFQDIKARIESGKLEAPDS